MALLRLLGGVDLEVDAAGQRIDLLKRQKCVALLAYLALEGPGVYVRRDKLAALFWPDLDQRHARAALRKCLHLVRASLGPEVLPGRGSEEVALEPEALDCDAVAFRRAVDEGRLDEALDLYRGDLLDAFFLRGCQEFDLWLHLKRVALQESAADSAWTLAFRRVAEGAVTDGERWAQRAVELACTDEARVREFMAALDAAGDRAAAVRFFERFEALLALELELEPSPETRADVERMLARESAADGGETSPPPVPVPAVAAAREDREDREDRDEEDEGAEWAARHRRTLLRGAVAAVLIGAGAFGAWGALRPVAEGPAPRLAVLPFDNGTGDPELDDQSRRIASFFFSELANAGVVRLVPPEDVAQRVRQLAADDGPAPATPRDWYEVLGVSLIIRGGFYSVASGDSLEFQAHLLGPGDSILRTAEPIRGPVDDPDAAIRRLGVRLVQLTAAYVAPGHQASLSSDFRGAYLPSPEAFWAYQDAWEEFTRSYAGSVRLIERVMELDSLYFAPYLLLRSAYANLGRYAEADSLCTVMAGRLHTADRLDRLLVERYCPALIQADRSRVDAARDLKEVSPGTGQYLLGLTLLNLNRHAEAAREFAGYDRTLGVVYERFEDRNAMFWGMALHQVGEYERELEVVDSIRHRFPGSERLFTRRLAALIALDRVDQALDTLYDWLAALPAAEDPTAVLHAAGMELQAHDRPEAAAEVWTEALDWYGQRPIAVRDARAGRLLRARLLLYLERYDDAARLLEPWVVSEPGDPESLGLLGVLRARQGDRDGARAIVRSFESSPPSVRAERGPLWRARILANLGEVGRTIDLLGQASAEGWTIRDRLHLDGLLTPLWGHPDFERHRQPKG